MVVDAAGLVDANAVKVGPSGSGTAQTAGDIVANETTIAGYIDTEVAAIKAKTDQLTFTVASQVDVNVVDWKGATAPAMTGDAYARLGAPAGASVSADVAAVKSDTGTILTDVNTGAGAIYTRLGAPAGASIAADIAAVNAKTTNLPASPAAVSDIPTANANADALLDRADGIETGYTPRKILRLMASVLFGKVSGGGTTTNTFRDLGDTKARVTSTVDGDGNRTAVTLDGT
jgi:hypothetical protein